MGKTINENELRGLVGGGSHQFNPMLFLPLQGSPVMAVFFFLGLEIPMVSLPLTVTPNGRYRLVTHFVINRQLQDAHRNKVLLQSRVNADQFVFGIIGTEAE